MAVCFKDLEDILFQQNDGSWKERGKEVRMKRFETQLKAKAKAAIRHFSTGAACYVTEGIHLLVSVCRGCGTTYQHSCRTDRGGKAIDGEVQVTRWGQASLPLSSLCLSGRERLVYLASL
mmetsp:Transcript_11145/g.21542  ORF Transcript_11145/g.21542 Transcript_11145/m.21542 type:complete len:120 (+) Transcript_11145:209-568(+)